MKKLIRFLVPAVFWLGVWTLCYSIVGRDLLIASPMAVFKKLEMVFTLPFWECVGISCLRTMEAYIIGIAAACLLAVACSASKLADLLIKPALTAIRATPVASFIILALVWLSSARVPVLAGVLMVVPVVFSNVYEGIRGTDTNLLELAKMYQWGKLKTVMKIYIPSLFPLFIAACEASIGLCFKATIAAEVIGTPKYAIGSQLYMSKIYLETDGVMAWTTVIILLSVIMEKLLKRLIHRSIRNAYHHE